MNRREVLLMAVLACVFTVRRAQAESDTNSLAGDWRTTVKIALVTFEVNDHSLKLAYKIKNALNQDIWLCEGIRILDQPTVRDYDVYWDPDTDATLVIRKRFEVPDEAAGYHIRAYQSTYVRLRPGEERIQAMSLPIPVEPYHILSFWDVHGTHDVNRVVIDVGVYCCDLPQVIQRICEISELLDCEKLTYPDVGMQNTELYDAYFGGLLVSAAFGGLDSFNDAHMADSDRVTLPHLWPISLGERSLKIVVNGVSFSYAGTPEPGDG